MIGVTIIGMKKVIDVHGDIITGISMTMQILNG